MHTTVKQTVAGGRVEGTTKAVDKELEQVSDYVSFPRHSTVQPSYRRCGAEQTEGKESSPR